MSELREKLEEIFENPLDKIILSNGNGTKYKKIVLSKEDSGFALEKFTEKQAFHERIAKGEACTYCESCMEDGFKQLNAFSRTEEYSMKISKKGKILSTASKNKNKVKLKKIDGHKKHYLLEEGEVILPLVDMGVLRRRGKSFLPCTTNTVRLISSFSL